MDKQLESKHKQKPIIVDGVVVFSVDEKLQSLIQFLTDNKINTFNSCQEGDRESCWIEYDLEDWLKISEISFRSESQRLYQFIDAECEVLLLMCNDGCHDENVEYWHSGDNLIWSVSVRFQNKLIPDFEEVIRTTLTES
jgi:hypothetical protein